MPQPNHAFSTEPHGLAIAPRGTSALVAFQTIDEITILARHVAMHFPDPRKAFRGLHELMVNAVEHGNLGIGYTEKSRLIENGAWYAEIERRLALPLNTTRAATLETHAEPHTFAVTIRDCGEGFDWPAYLDFPAGRADHAHGRGIAIAHALGFATITYRGNGNTVICRTPR